MTQQVSSFFHPFFVSSGDLLELQRERLLPAFQKCCDVINEVGQYLSTPDLISMSCTCKDWNNFLVHHEVDGVQIGALSLRGAALRQYVAQHGFGLQKWKHYFGNRDCCGVRSCFNAMKRAILGRGEQQRAEKSRLPLGLLDILHSPCPFFRGEQVKDTHILFYLPQTFEGKPVALSTLREFAQNLKKRDGQDLVKYSFIFRNIMEQYEDPVSDAAYWILMTKNKVPRSRAQSFDEWRKWIPRGQEFKMPKVLEAVVGFFLHYVASEEEGRMTPKMSTRCQEEVGCFKVVISAKTIYEQHLFHSSLECYEENGFSVLQKFPAV